MGKKDEKTGIQPRFIYLADAAAYCGLEKPVFESEIRPRLPTIGIGKQQRIGFDRFDLDEAMQYRFEVLAFTKGHLKQHAKPLADGAMKPPQSFGEKAALLETSKALQEASKRREVYEATVRQIRDTKKAERAARRALWRKGKDTGES